MQSILVLLAAYVLGISQAQVVFRGPCPNPTLQTDFDITKYTGHWYEMERYFAIFEVGSRCVTADYTLQGDGSLLVNNTGYYSILGSYRSTIGDAVGTDPSNPAKLGVRFSTSQPRGPYWVVSTDYGSYSVVWSCSEQTVPIFGLKWNAQFLWILTRQQEGISTIVRNNIFTMLQGYGISTDDLSPTDQSSCP